MPRPFITLPAAREVPTPVLRALRDVSPRAELVYAGEGAWWLGEVREDVGRIAEGRRRLAKLRTRGGRVGAFRMAHCMAAGFGLLDTLHGDPLAAWADHLARFVYTTERQVDAAAETALAHAEGAHITTQRRERLQEFARLEGASIHRHARRKADGVSLHTVPAAPSAA